MNDMQITKMQQITIEQETTLDDFFKAKGLNSSLYFVARNGIALQDSKTILKIKDVVRIIPKVAGG